MPAPIIKTAASLFSSGSVLGAALGVFVGLVLGSDPFVKQGGIERSSARDTGRGRVRPTRDT